MKKVGMIQIERFTCPACGEVNGVASQIAGPGISNGPRPGDIGLCGGCAIPLLLVAPGEVRLATEADFGVVPPSIRKVLDEATKKIRQELN